MQARHNHCDPLGETGVEELAQSDPQVWAEFFRETSQKELDNLTRERQHMARQRGTTDLSHAGASLAKEDFVAARLPLLQASTHPSYCYTSREFYELEVERIFLREWLCVGRVDQVEKPGDYFTLRLLGESLVVVRDREGEIRVLSTVCRHRGMEIVEGAGARRSFECPYHGWTYSLRGELMGAPEMEKTENFDKRQCQLPSLRAESWEGFIFVNFDLQAQPLGPALAGLSQQLKNYKLSEMRSIEPLVYDCNWNWKIMVENMMECYHHLGLHRDTVEPLMPGRLTTTEDLDGAYAIMHLPTIEQDVGLSGQGSYVKRMEALSLLPVIEGLSPEERGKAIVFTVYPTHMVILTPDSMIYYQAFPEGADRMTLRITLCVPPSTMERPDVAQSLKQARDFIVMFNNQDMWACESVQRGLSSRLARPGRYCHLEKAIWQISRYVMRRVLETEDTAYDDPSAKEASDS